MPVDTEEERFERQTLQAYAKFVNEHRREGINLLDDAQIKHGRENFGWRDSFSSLPYKPKWKMDLELDRLSVEAAPSNKRARLDGFEFNPNIDLPSAESSTSGTDGSIASSSSRSGTSSLLNMDLGFPDQFSDLSGSQRTTEN